MITKQETVKPLEKVPGKKPGTTRYATPQYAPGEKQYQPNNRQVFQADGRTPVSTFGNMDHATRVLVRATLADGNKPAARKARNELAGKNLHKKKPVVYTAPTKKA